MGEIIWPDPYCGTGPISWADTPWLEWQCYNWCYVGCYHCCGEMRFHQPGGTCVFKPFTTDCQFKVGFWWCVCYFTLVDFIPD